MDFFQTTCQESTINDSLFGICDDRNGQKAYIDVNDQTKWAAMVKNEDNNDIVFTAIDKCLIKDHEVSGRGRCDGMLTSDRHLYFIELKDEIKGWISKAIEQLESTIQFLIANHDISVYKYKKAFACNRKHPRFHEIDNELNLRFFRTYGFRLDVQSEIIVV